MGDAQSVPVIGEVVTVVESGAKIIAAGACAAYGEIANDRAAVKTAEKLAEGAGQSWVEYSEKNIIVGSVNALAKKLNDDDEGAKRVMKKTLGSFEGFVDSVPVVGHVKGGVHYIAGDKEHGDRCMLGATRGAAVLLAGAATGGLGAGLVVGGIAGVGGGVAYDGIATAIDDKPHGTFATIQQFEDTEDPNSILDLSLGIVGDFAAGAAGAKAANQFKQARNIKVQRNAVRSAFEKAQGSDVATFDAKVATRDTVKAAKNLHCLTEEGVLKGDAHVSTIVRDLETNEVHQGYSARARQNINMKNFEQNGTDSGFNSKTNAKNSATRGPSTLEQLHPEVEQVIKSRKQNTCAEHDAFNKVFDKTRALGRQVQVVSVKLVKGIYSAVIRCENCLAYGEIMGNVVTDLINGQYVPVAQITPYVTKGCACGVLAIATRQAKHRVS